MGPTFTISVLAAVGYVAIPKAVIYAEDDIRPFRDVLLGLFFVTTGMEVDPSTITAAPMAILAWIIACLPGKALVVLLVGAIMRWPAPVSTRAALIPAHGGEDGLLLLTLAMKVGAIEPNVGQPALLALAATMALGPMLILRVRGLRSSLAVRHIAPRRTPKRPPSARKVKISGIT
jgi:Kef-type K+ transport system membrane component KefB